MAATAIQSQSEPCQPCRFDSIKDRFHEPFLFNPTAFSIQSMIAIEPRRDNLILSRIGQHVTGQLLNGKLIKRHVGIVSLDHPVAPRPHFATAVDLKSIAVGVASIVQPTDRHAFAVMR